MRSNEGSWRFIKWVYSPAAEPVSNQVRKLCKKSDDNNQSRRPNFQKLSMLQSCDGWADKMRCFFIRVWNTCTNLRKSTLLLICYFCCPFHCQSHSLLPKEACFSIFAAEKNFFEASYWTLFSSTLWYLSWAPGGARSANSSNVSVRPASCLDLPTQQTSQTVVVVGLATDTSWLSSTAQTRELQLNLSKQKQLQLWGSQGKEERQVLSTENHWIDGWSERYWSLF